jgi:hypothetical protein
MLAMKIHIRLAAIVAVLLSFVSIASAQPAGVQQLQQSQMQMQMPPLELRVGTNAPELYAGENEDIGAQRILRLANGNKVEQSHREWLDVSADSQVFYSDNANFSGHSGQIGSWVFVNTVQAALAPTPWDLGPGKFGPAAGFISQWYNYSSGRMHALDFNAQTAFANLRYFYGNWQFTAGANYTRLLGQDSYEETYREWLPSVSLQRVFQLNDRLALAVGDVVDYHFTHTPALIANFTPDDLNDHVDEMVYLSLNWQVTPHLAVQPFYRFQYSWYPKDSVSTTVNTDTRNDWLNSVGLNVLYAFNQHASVRAFLSYNTKWSDDKFTSHYDEFNGGIGGMVDIRF